MRIYLHYVTLLQMIHASYILQDSTSGLNIRNRWCAAHEYLISQDEHHSQQNNTSPPSHENVNNRFLEQCFKYKVIHFLYMLRLI